MPREYNAMVVLSGVQKQLDLKEIEGLDVQWIAPSKSEGGKPIEFQADLDGQSYQLAYAPVEGHPADRIWNISDSQKIERKINS